MSVAEPQPTVPKLARRWYQPYLLVLLGVVAAIAVVLGLMSYLGPLCDPFGHAYEKIRIGMTACEVESMLGPGMQERRCSVEEAHWDEQLKRNRSVPVVAGDSFLMWTNQGRKIVVGVRNGNVCDKWYWEPSL